LSPSPGDLALLRAVYRQVDRAALRAEFPGLTDDEIRAFFLRLSGFVKSGNGPVCGGGGAEAAAGAASQDAPPPEGVRRAILHADGGSRGNPGLSGFGVVLLDPSGAVLAEKGECIGHATSNEAEYRGLIAGLRMALDHGVTDLTIHMDSDLVVNQVNGDWKIRKAHLQPLAREAHALLARFAAWRVRHIPRERNARADALANRAMDRGETRNVASGRGD